MVQSITSLPPKRIRQERAKLAQLLDDRVPRKRDLGRNLLLATWNIWNFGDVTRRWNARADDSPKRDLRCLLHIGEIVSRFDVVAVQEARANLAGIRHLLKLLNRSGDDWGLVLTDENHGPKGNHERMAFVYDRRRVSPSGLAAEVVLDPTQEFGVDAGAGQRQFVRTPYAVSFQAGGATFILLTAHIYYGQAERDRILEVGKIAEWLGSWAADIHRWHHNLITLGDFNIVRQENADGSINELWEAFMRTGLHVPGELDGRVARTIFDTVGGENFYDQIAWFQTGGRALMNLEYSGRAGNFIFTDAVLRELPTQAVKYRISDHYPLWAEFAGPDR